MPTANGPIQQIRHTQVNLDQQAPGQSDWQVMTDPSAQANRSHPDAGQQAVHPSKRQVPSIGRLAQAGHNAQQGLRQPQPAYQAPFAAAVHAPVAPSPPGASGVNLMAMSRDPTQLPANSSTLVITSQPVNSTLGPIQAPIQASDQPTGTLVGESTAHQQAANENAQPDTAVQLQAASLAAAAGPQAACPPEACARILPSINLRHTRTEQARQPVPMAGAATAEGAAPADATFTGQADLSASVPAADYEALQVRGLPCTTRLLKAFVPTVIAVGNHIRS